jgi:hypothetical protein
VLEHAASVWSQALDGVIPIRIDVSFAPQERCVVGGGAQAAELIYGEPGLNPELVYPVALAERILELELNEDDADIVAFFNSELCADGPQWYMGLDGEGPQGTVDLVTLALHEFAHGLGFASTVSPYTGESWLEGVLDPYSAQIYDTKLEKGWSEMSTAELAESVVGKRALVWNGEHATMAASRLLGIGTPTLEMDPAIENFTGLIGEPNVGPWVTEPIVARLRTPSPADGCTEQPNNGIQSVMLVEHGGCPVEEKADLAERAGALALLVVAEFPDSPPDSLRVESQTELALPVLVITQADTELLQGAGAVEVNIGVASDRPVGADQLGRPYIYVADPIEQGTSLSHWDPLLRPSRLLEPIISPDTGYLDVRVEKAALRDIGWASFCGNGRLDESEQCDDGPRNGASADCLESCELSPCAGLLDAGCRPLDAGRVDAQPDAADLFDAGTRVQIESEAGALSDGDGDVSGASVRGDAAVVTEVDAQARADAGLALRGADAAVTADAIDACVDCIDACVDCTDERGPKSGGCGCLLARKGNGDAPGLWWVFAVLVAQVVRRRAASAIRALTLGLVASLFVACGAPRGTFGPMPEAARVDCILPPVEVDLTFQSPDGLWLEGTVSFPERHSNASLPAVVLAHPAGPQSRDGVAEGQWGLPFGFELPVLQQLAHGLTRRGFVVLRFDKRSCGRFNECADNEYPKPEHAATLLELHGDVAAAVSAVARLPTVDGERIHLFGYGESAVFVPQMLGFDPRIRSAVAFALDHHRMGEAELGRARRLERFGAGTGLPQTEVDAQVREARALGWDLEELAFFGVGGPVRVQGQPDRFWVEAIRSRARSLSTSGWSSDRSLLLLFGERDWTTGPPDIRWWEGNLSTSGANATAIALPCITHALNCLTQDEPSGIERQHIGRVVDPAVIDVVAEHFESAAPVWPHQAEGERRAQFPQCKGTWPSRGFELALDGTIGALPGSDGSCLSHRGCPTVDPIPFCSPGLEPKARDEWPNDGQPVAYAARLGVQRGGVTLVHCEQQCCNSGDGSLDLRQTLGEPGIHFEMSTRENRCWGDESDVCCSIPPHTKDGGGLVIATGIVKGQWIVGVELCRPRPEHYSHIIEFNRDLPPLRKP